MEIVVIADSIVLHVVPAAVWCFNAPTNHETTEPAFTYLVFLKPLHFAPPFLSFFFIAIISLYLSLFRCARTMWSLATTALFVKATLE